MFDNREKEGGKEIEAALGSKNTYRGCDYRLSLITVYERIKEGIPSEVKELLYTSKEISRLAYQSMLNPLLKLS